jgi:hypothetical protein
VDLESVEATIRGWSIMEIVSIMLDAGWARAGLGVLAGWWATRGQGGALTGRRLARGAVAGVMALPAAYCVADTIVHDVPSGSYLYDTVYWGGGERHGRSGTRCHRCLRRAPGSDRCPRPADRAGRRGRPDGGAAAREERCGQEHRAAGRGDGGHCGCQPRDRPFPTPTAAGLTSRDGGRPSRVRLGALVSWPPVAVWPMGTREHSLARVSAPALRACGRPADHGDPGATRTPPSAL